MSNKGKKTCRSGNLTKSGFSKLVVKAAKQIKDPLNHFSLPTKYEANGLNLSISCLPVNEVGTETLEWIIKLTATNMRKLYDDCEWGWNEDEKLQEFMDKDAVFLIARDVDSKPQAFVHFRIDVDFGLAVLYCYEIQLENSVQRKGLGKFLMKLLQDMGTELKLSKVVLTVLKHNQDAMDFYTKGLRFQIDKTSPSVSTKEEVCYEILGKSCK